MELFGKIFAVVGVLVFFIMSIAPLIIEHEANKEEEHDK